ncbi:hypothetical protein [Kitasatospora camelliae]|uniref:Uncharacterized protein n=1 Tax=Kitasatospora camelliae TaxID=3156397 RepID=A0AAU8K6A8_9ACTN
MSLVGWILVIALAAAGTVGWRLYRYPGGWRYAFAREHTAARRDLDAARGALRGLERSAKRELSGARAAVEAATAAHRRRVRAAEEHLAHLRDPGRGGLRDELPGLSLYEHVLAVKSDDWQGDLPLDRIAVRSDHTAKAGHIYLIAPDGHQHLLTYPTETTDEESVRAFVVDVHNAIAQAKAFQRDRPARIRRAEADLLRVRDDTAVREQAELHLDEVTARQNADPRIPKARRSLDAAHDRWENLTGHRPT